MPTKRTITNTLEDTFGLIFPPFKIANNLKQWWQDRNDKNRYWPQAVDALVRLIIITAVIALYLFSIPKFWGDLLSVWTAMGISLALSIPASLIAGLLSSSTRLGIAAVAPRRDEERTQAQRQASRAPMLLLFLSIVTTGFQYFAATTTLTLPSGLAEFSTLFDLFGPASAIALSLTALALPLIILTTYRYVSLRQEVSNIRQEAANPLTFARFFEILLFGDSPSAEDNQDLPIFTAAEDSQDLFANPPARGRGTNTTNLLKEVFVVKNPQQQDRRDTPEQAEKASASSDSKSDDQDHQTPPPHRPSAEPVSASGSQFSR